MIWSGNSGPLKTTCITASTSSLRARTAAMTYDHARIKIAKTTAPALIICQQCRQVLDATVHEPETMIPCSEAHTVRIRLMSV